MNFPSQDSYDVVKDGRFVGRMLVPIHHVEQVWFQFELCQTFFDVHNPTNNRIERIEMPLVKFVFTDGSVSRIFDATNVPITSLHQVSLFRPAYGY